MLSNTPQENDYGVHAQQKDLDEKLLQNYL
jgi:hypothetical protein